MRYKSTGTGEWPVGIHWSPGEIKDVPDGYPGGDTTPAPWLKPAKKKAKAKPKED